MIISGPVTLRKIIAPDLFYYFAKTQHQVKRALVMILSHKVEQGMKNPCFGD